MAAQRAWPWHRPWLTRTVSAPGPDSVRESPFMWLFRLGEKPAPSSARQDVKRMRGACYRAISARANRVTPVARRSMSRDRETAGQRRGDLDGNDGPVHDLGNARGHQRVGADP